MRNKSFQILKLIAAAFTGTLFVLIGMKFISQTYGASPVWPATGLFAFFVFEFGIWSLPIAFFSYLFGQLLNGAHFETIYLGLIGATLETYIYFIFKDKIFQNLKSKFLGQITINLFLISLIGGLASAILGVSELYKLGFIKFSEFPTTFFSWMLGNMLGFLFITPSLVILKNLGLSKYLNIFLDSWRSLLLIATSLIAIFYFPVLNPAIFILFFTLIIASAVDGRKGFMASSLLVYFFSIAMTLYGLSPFTSGTQNENLVALQILLLSFSILGFGLSEIKFKYFSKSLKISVAFISILFSIIYFFLYKAEVNKDELRFNEKTELYQTNLKTKFQTYANFLTSAESFYEVKGNVTELDWKNYVSNLSLLESYPGINGMGIIEYVPKNNLEQFTLKEQKMRPEFKIKYLDNNIGNSNGDHYIVKYVEPLATNKSAIGLDIASEKRRERAALYAKNTGMTTMTDPIILVQDKIKRPGFLMFSPRFDKKSAILGWVYAPFITSDFIKPTLDVLQNEVEIKILDTVEDENKNDEIFSNFNIHRGYRPIEQIRKLSFGNNFWIIKFFSTPSFSSERWRISAWIMVLSTITLLIVIIGLSILENSTKAAEKMAQELSEKLLQSSKLSALGEMAAGIAHEINNPLMIIKGKAELLQLKLSKNSTIEADSIEKMKTIILTTDRISLIIKGLKQFSRDAESDPFATENLKSIVEDTLNFCRDRFYQSNIKLLIDQIPDVNIECRRVQIEQVLVNILNNALDASIEESEKWVKLEFNTDESFVSIFIINSGKKIPDHVANKMMEPFFTTKPVGKGTGLGLSISRSIIAAHKGTLSLNQEHQHTCFVIKIPKMS